MTYEEALITGLIERRKAAERVVEGMPEGETRAKAYELAYADLSSSAQHLPKKQEKRQSRRAASKEPPRATSTSTKKPRRPVGAQGHLDELVRDGFFNEDRSIPDMVEELRVRGHTYRQNQLSKPLLRLTRAKALSRTERSRGGDSSKKIWHYRQVGS